MRRLRVARRGGSPGGGESKRDSAWLEVRTWLRMGTGVLSCAALCLILLGYNVFPGRVSLGVGEPSPALIRAPRMAQYVDREETERLRREARQRVPPQYRPLIYARADAEQRVSQAFAELEAARGARDPKEKLRAGAQWVPEESTGWLLSASSAELQTLEGRARAIVREVMSKEIREATADVKAAQEEAEKAAYRLERRPDSGALLAAVVRREVGPNRRYDPEATAQAREEAAKRVQEVVRTIDADQVIIVGGERVTREHLAMLEALGLVSPRLDYRRITSIIVLASLVVLLLGVQTRHWAPGVYANPKRLLLLALLAVGSIFVINLLTLALPNVWMLIVPAAALMAAVLLGDAVGMALALALSLLVGLMANAGLPAVLLSLGSAAAALAFAADVWPVSRLRWVVASMAATNLVLVAAVGLLEAGPVRGIIQEAGLAALLYSPGAAILGLGGVFVLQRPFGITTHLGLLELSNPQVPLLRKLQSEAPGTYHHSAMVANLAEAAAEVVGADALLARVGALYHDVGKLNRPAFFVENQALLGQENVHDRLSSSLSGLVIISHVKDGVEVGRKHGLPPEVVDIIAQHHGTTLVSYFYHRALTGARPESVSEDQFRYPGPFPDSKEAALVMLADSVQAAAKSVAEPTPHRVQQMVREIIRDRMVDGQLEKCELTFRDLGAVEATMSRILTATLIRNRVEYPEPVVVDTQGQGAAQGGAATGKPADRLAK